MKLIDRLKRWAKALKREVGALYLAGRDPRTPLVAKVLAVALVAYALSPIDLIPDFIPVLGYLDDLIILPLGLLLVVRLIPPDLMAEFRQEAKRSESLPQSRAAAIAIVGLWILAALLLAYWLFGG